MRLIARDDVFRYYIEAPDDCEVQMQDDFLIVPAPTGSGIPLFDELLVEAARSGEFGLRMLAEIPLN